MSGRRITNDDIRTYYASTLRDYQAVWFAGDSLSMHFGYQEKRGTTHANSLISANRALADLVGIAPGERVLDCGCGLGATSIWLAKARRARVTGITLGVDQITQATCESARWAFRIRPDFLVADFTGLPFAGASFDVVWAQESLCHTSDKATFFREVSRVLTPGGRVIVADFMLRRTAQTKHHRNLIDQWCDGWKMADLWTAAQHVSAAHTASLDNVAVHDFTPYTIKSHRRLYHWARRAWPIETVLRRIGLRSSVQHGNFVAALRQFETLESECWFYGVLTARKR
jgi:tocopherol O-methyltransferase